MQSVLEADGAICEKPSHPGISAGTFAISRSDALTTPTLSANSFSLSLSLSLSLSPLHTKIDRHQRLYFFIVLKFPSHSFKPMRPFARRCACATPPLLGKLWNFT